MGCSSGGKGVLSLLRLEPDPQLVPAGIAAGRARLRRTKRGQRDLSIVSVPWGLMGSAGCSGVGLSGDPPGCAGTGGLDALCSIPSIATTVLSECRPSISNQK